MACCHTLVGLGVRPVTLVASLTLLPSGRAAAARRDEQQRAGWRERPVPRSCRVTASACFGCADVLRAALWDRCRVGTSGIGTRFGAAAGPENAAVDLYWLPLGAGGHFVRLNGRVFEAAAARAERRPACDLYHSALEVRLAAARFVIEQTPVRDARGEQRGVVAEGPVGTRWAGRFRIFRYEIRRWRDGRIPDVDEAVGSPLRLTDERAHAQQVLDRSIRDGA